MQPNLLALLSLTLMSATAITSAQEVMVEPVLIENWLLFQQNTNHTGQWQYDPRIYIPFKFQNGWRITPRADLPIINTNKNGPANETGHYSAGIGNPLLETVIETPELTPNLTLRGSLRLVFPSPKGEPFGSGEYQIAPMLGMSYRMPAQFSDITLSPFARYFRSMGTSTNKSTKISTLDIYPEITFKLDQAWSVSLYSEHAVTYNYVKQSWFVPFDFLLVKQLTSNASFALGGAFKLGNPADASYNYIVNTRLNFSY